MFNWLKKILMDVLDYYIKKKFTLDHGNSIHVIDAAFDSHNQCLCYRIAVNTDSVYHVQIDLFTKNAYFLKYDPSKEDYRLLSDTEIKNMPDAIMAKLNMLQINMRMSQKLTKRVSK